MTISAYIVNLLKEYGGIKINTNHVPDGSDKYGLYKSPSRDINNFTDGSYQITEYYQFFARQASSSPSERKEADEWLEDLTYWLDDYQYKYELPEIDGSRTVEKIVITGCPYPIADDCKGTMYQMSLAITYTREREDS